MLTKMSISSPRETRVDLELLSNNRLLGVSTVNINKLAKYISYIIRCNYGFICSTIMLKNNSYLQYTTHTHTHVTITINPQPNFVSLQRRNRRRSAHLILGCPVLTWIVSASLVPAVLVHARFHCRPI